MRVPISLTATLLAVCVILVKAPDSSYAVVMPEMHRMLEPGCPGTCIEDCKLIGGNFLGNCMDGKMCCADMSAGLNIPIATCGSSFMARKVSGYRSPNYPVYSGGNLICDFTLQLNPATVGIRVDFLDLNLASIPTNPLNFYESQNPVCDSDFMMLKGFSDWSPDLRCGNLTGYSFMIEREIGQPSLTTLFIMGSKKYRWNILYTEIFYNEMETMDYALRNALQGNNNNKKQWIWYPSSGLSPPLSPMGPPSFPPSMLAPPTFQFHSFNKRNAENFSDEVEIINSDGLWTSTSVNYSATEAAILPRVVGGIDAQPNSIPWQVSLQLVEKMPSALCGQNNIKNLSSHFCGGSIIGERTILTASHCFFSSSRYTHPLVPAGAVKVVIGEHDLCSDNEVSTTREYTIQRVILHYNYLSADVINDIAMIQLTKPIYFDQNVHPIKLADENTKMESLKPLLSGWGSLGVEENSTYPAILQQSSNMQIFSEKECQHFQREFLEYVLPDSKLPGKYRGAFDHGICTKATDNIAEAGFGDSGGPIAGISSGESKNPVLLGIVSHMRPHNDPETNVQFHMNYFVKVAMYRKWIALSTIT